MIQLKNRYFLAIILYCMALFWLSNQTDIPIPDNALFTFPGADKVVHAALFGGLAACLSIGIRRSNDQAPIWAQWFVPVVFVILYGMTDEWHQTFVPGRNPEGKDLLADAVGGIIAQLVLFIRWGRARNNGGK